LHWGGEVAASVELRSAAAAAEQTATDFICISLIDICEQTGLRFGRIQDVGMT
jgi:hypothetical protein